MRVPFPPPPLWGAPLPPPMGALQFHALAGRSVSLRYRSGAPFSQILLFRRCSYKEQPYKYDCPTLQIHCQFFQPISSLTLVGTNCVCEHGIMLINNVSHKVIDLFNLNPIPIIAWILKIINILPIGYIQIVIFL